MESGDMVPKSLLPGICLIMFSYKTQGWVFFILLFLKKKKKQQEAKKTWNAKMNDVKTRSLSKKTIMQMEMCTVRGRKKENMECDWKKKMETP